MSNNLEIGIYKGRDGWSARSRVALDDYGLPGRILDINTYKGFRGGVWTHAQCVKIEGGFQSFVIYGDFSKTVLEDRKARCTEKNVKQMQEAAIAQRDTLIAECVNFYRKKESAQ